MIPLRFFSKNSSIFIIIYCFPEIDKFRQIKKYMLSPQIYNFFVTTSVHYFRKLFPLFRETLQITLELLWIFSKITTNYSKLSLK